MKRITFFVRARITQKETGLKICLSKTYLHLPIKLSLLRGEQLQNDFPNIDVLINNVAIQFTSKFLDDDFCYEMITHEINLNFTAVCALSYLLLPALLHDGHEAVITNINSGLGLSPKTSSAIYCATKGAMNIFSQSLQYQLEATNIRIMQVFLPLVDTPAKGRGDKKLSPDYVSDKIINGIEGGIRTLNISKVKFLRFLIKFMPFIAILIMKRD
jgi:short-subunit dehydrogenase involved in D-alanine esterification of teichoic acids